MDITKWGAIAVATALVVGAVAVSVWASEPVVVGGRDKFNPNRTIFQWARTDQQTSNDEFKKIGGLGNFSIKHYGPLVATVTVQVSGSGPARFRLANGPFRPQRATFDPMSPERVETFSFTAVLHNEEWTCTDAGLRWRSPTGAPLDLHLANVVVDYKVTKEQPDFACR